MNLRMAKSASLILRRLIVERRRAGRVCKRCRMARKAQQIYVADFQQVGIRRSVRRVARLAAFDLHRLMFKHKRSALFRVAGVAHRVLRRGRPHLFRLNCAVRIVAVVALHQPLVHSMMERHRELRFLLCVAAVAKFRLFLYQQKFRILAVMRRVAIQAAHIVLVMHRPPKIHLLFTRNMARQAALVDCFRARRLETENFLHVAGIVSVRSSRSMTTFATLMRRATALVQRRFEMWRFFEAIEKVFVASLAGFRPDVSAIRRRLRGCRSLSSRLLFRIRRR